MARRRISRKRKGNFKKSGKRGKAIRKVYVSRGGIRL